MINVEDRLQSLMRQVFDIDDLVLDRNLTANDVEGWDSLANIHLIIAVEREFKISTTVTEVVRLKNAGDLIDLIRAKADGGSHRGA